MSANVSLATMYTLACAILSFGTYRLYRYNKALIDFNSELSAPLGKALAKIFGIYDVVHSTNALGVRLRWSE